MNKKKQHNSVMVIKIIIETKNFDDGSLAYLGIKPNEREMFFDCPEISVNDLIDRKFWIVDYLEDVKTRYGKRYLVKIKFNKDDDDSKARKFFTNSFDIKSVLSQIRELNAFPRKVTMRISGLRTYLE